MNEYAKKEKENIDYFLYSNLYALEKNRLKERKFISVNPYELDYFGLSLTDLKVSIYADIYARYNRLKGYNVLFNPTFDLYSLKTKNLINKEGLLFNNFKEQALDNYETELKYSDLSFDFKKELFFDDLNFIKNVDKFFYLLLDKGLIEVRQDDIYYDDLKVYQAGNVIKQGNSYYTRDFKKLEHQKKNNCYINISSIKDKVVEEVKSLNLKEEVIKKLLNEIGFYNGIEVIFNTSTAEEITLKMDEPEYLFGVSFIIINPTKIDIKKYLDSDFDLKVLNYQNVMYSGFEIINYLNGYHIPVYLSKNINEDCHYGIPSLNEDDELFADKYELPFLPIFDYIDDKQVLVNSGLLNGFDSARAKEVITDHLIKIGIANIYQDIKANYLNITNIHNFGIPIPLTKDKEKVKIPVYYDYLKEIKYQDNEIAAKNLSKEFFNPEFIRAFHLYMEKLYQAEGIVDLDDFETKELITSYEKVNLYVLSEKTKDNLVWDIILSNLFEKVYGDSFKTYFDEIVILNDTNKVNNTAIKKTNNNIVSIRDFLENNSASLIRLAFIKSNFNDTNFNLNMISDLEEELDYLTSIFDILSDTDELDEDFNNMQNKLNEHIENRDLKKYYEEILNFVDKVVSFGSISIKKAQVLLTYLSILFPSLSEGYAKEKLNMKDLVYYSSWDL